ncbi:MAG: hypothetical protein WCC60_13880 [Ilumatobacteraceae bacterium]
MPEYNIRTKENREWPRVHRDLLPSVLMPEGFGCAPADGWGDFRMTCSGSTITFSGEEIGWQVSVEGSMGERDADALIAAVTEQVEQASGEACEWLAIG